MISLFFAVLVLGTNANPIQAQTQDDDFWRQNGTVPEPIACVSLPISTTPLNVGDTVTITSTELCDYYGILLEPSSEGGFDIGWMQQGHWVSFDMALSTAGLFNMTIRTASKTGEGAFDLVNQGTSEVYKVFSGVANTQGWQNWETMDAGLVALRKGSTTLRVNSLQSGWNLLSMNFTLVEAFITYDYMVFAQNFDRGHVGVELAESSEGTLNLDYIFSGDELFFNLTLPQSGKYEIYARISNPEDVGSFAIAHRQTGQVFGMILTLPTTSSWGEWTTVLVGEAYFDAGTHNMELFVLQGGFNLEFLGLNFIDSATGDSEDNHYLVPAKDYTNTNGVEVDPNNGNVGSLDPGDWIEYSLNVVSTGVYILQFYVASPEGWGSFKVVNPQTQEIYGGFDSLPTTESWFSWVSVDIPNVSLSQGTVPIKLEITNGGFNFFVIAFELASDHEEEV